MQAGSQGVPQAPRARRKSVGDLLRTQKITFVTTSVDSVESDSSGERDAPIAVRITLDGKPVTMDVDTGTVKTIMPEKTLWPGNIGCLCRFSLV